MPRTPRTEALTSSTFDYADLCAQVAPLDCYGPTSLGAALATGLESLASVLKGAASTVRRRVRRS